MEMNGDLILVTGDIITWSLEATGVHCTSTVTSVSTVSGSVTVQVRVCEVPSYSGPLGTLRSRVGVGTAIKIIYTREEESWICITVYKRTPTVLTVHYIIVFLTSDSDSVWCGGDGHIIHCCW